MKNWTTNCLLQSLYFFNSEIIIYSNRVHLVVRISDDENNFEKFEIVKRYFARIFNVLSKEIRQELLNLDLTEEELKDVRKELGFLPVDQQKEYIKELIESRKVN